MDLYEQNLSDVTLNKRRLKQLDQIFIEELQEIKEDMKYQKRQRIRKVCWRIIYCNKDENDKIPHVMILIRSFIYHTWGIFNVYCF